VQEAEEKSQAAEDEKRRKREAEMQAINLSRQEQLARKAEAKLKEARDGQQFKQVPTFWLTHTCQ
jgi:hypothetical protein